PTQQYPLGRPRDRRDGVPVDEDGVRLGRRLLAVRRHPPRLASADPVTQPAVRVLMTWLRTKATIRRRPLERPNGRSPEASKRRNRRSPASLVLLYLALLVGTVIALYPVFVMVTGSTKTLAEVMRIP